MLNFNFLEKGLRLCLHNISSMFFQKHFSAGVPMIRCSGNYATNLKENTNTEVRFCTFESHFDIGVLL